MLKSKAKADTKPPIPVTMCAIYSKTVIIDCDSKGSIAINDSVISEERSIPGGDYGMKFVLSEFFFKPIYALGAWQSPEDSDNRYVSIAILLLAVQDTTSSYSVDVVDGGNYLEYSVTQSILSENPRLLHRKWIKVDVLGQIMHYHPRVTCFNLFIRRLRGDHEISVLLPGYFYVSRS